DVFLVNNSMRDVASPVTLWTKGANPVGRVTIDGLHASAVYRSALSVESWSDIPITNLVVRNSSIEFKGGGTSEQAKQTVDSPGVDARPLPCWGVYGRNVAQLTFEDVRLSLAQRDLRPVLTAERVENLVLENFKFTPQPEVPQSAVLSKIGKL